MKQGAVQVTLSDFWLYLTPLCLCLKQKSDKELIVCTFRQLWRDGNPGLSHVVPLECWDVTRVRSHVFQALDGKQLQGSVALLYTLGFELRRAVPEVEDKLCFAVVSADDGGRVGSGEGPGKCEVLQVPGDSAGDGDVLIFRWVDFHPGGERVHLRFECEVVVNWRKNRKWAD